MGVVSWNVFVTNNEKTGLGKCTSHNDS